MPTHAFLDPYCIPLQLLDTIFSFGLVVFMLLMVGISQIATESDLGLADAYINGWCSFDDKKEGLLNLILVKLYHSSDWAISPLFFFSD